MTAKVVTLGEAIQAKLDQLKISKSEFARRLEVDPSYISRIVSNERKPAIDMLKKMAKILNIRFADLAALVGEMTAEVKKEPAKGKTTPSTGRKTVNAQKGKENTVKGKATETISVAKFNTLRQINPNLTFIDVDDDGGVIVDSGELNRTKQTALATAGGGVTPAKAAALAQLSEVAQETVNPAAFADTRSTCRLENAKRYSKSDKAWKAAPRLFKLVDSYGKKASWTVKNEALREAFNTGQASYARYDGTCTYVWDSEDKITVAINGETKFSAILSRKAVAGSQQVQDIILNPKAK